MITAATASIFCTVVVAIAAMPQGNGPPSVLAPKVSELKATVHRLLEGSRIRKKRELQGLTDESDYKLRVGSATDGDLPYLSEYNLTFWIPVQHMSRSQVLVGTTKGHIMLFEISDNDDKSAKTIAVSKVEDYAIKAKAFSHNDEQWFVVLHSSKNKYYIQLYLLDGRGLEERQKIELTGFSDMEMITMKGMHYLIVASYSTSINEGFSYQASLTLYNWPGTQFDALATRKTYGARSVTCWDMDGTLYVAVAQETDDKGNDIGSPVFMYNNEEKKLVLWELLSTVKPSKLHHFKVAGNNYIIFIGMQDAVIYWWSNGQFLAWQYLSGTAFASDVSVLTLRDGEVAIVIALKEAALFYTLDSSGYYIRTFYRESGGSSLISLQFTYTKRAYYALALFEKPQTQYIWKLTLARQYMPPVSLLNTFQQCLLDSEEMLKERQAELEIIKSDLSRVWLKGSNQTVPSNVVVKGKIVSEDETNVKNITIITYKKFPSSSMVHVKSLLERMEDATDHVKHELDTAVSKKKPQEIKSDIVFADLLYIPSLTLESIEHDIRINGFEVSRLKNYALKKSGNQTFVNPAVISSISAHTADIQTLNGISTDDLLLLHGKQVVTGDLKFFNVEASDLAADTINSIPVENIVTTNSIQDIKELKHFSSLKADVIDVSQQTNGENLAVISKKIATIDDYNEFSGKLTFIQPVNFNSNLYITEKINRLIDLTHLATQSVDKEGQQDLSGLYRFKKMSVTGDVLVAGHVNHVAIDNLLTINTNQNVYEDMKFETLTINSDLEVDLVNGIDLSQQILRKTLPYQFVAGRKTFLQDMTADFIEMPEYVTLDGVDPSLLVQDIVEHMEGVVDPHPIVLRDVIVLGNVTALGGINGYQIMDLNNSVWLKSRPQAIMAPLHAKTLHFKDDLNVGTVNGLDVEHDIVNSFSDEEILSSKTFENVTTKSLNIGENVYINGINPASYQKELDHYEHHNEVHGNKNINDLEISGSLNLNKFNEMTLENFMRPDVFQQVKGAVEFASEITTVLNSLNLNDISFEKFNNLNLRDYFKNAVLPNHRRAVLNKKFSNVKASNLSLTTNSKINGINFQEFVKNVVTLNTPQIIKGQKSFISDLDFSNVYAANLNGLDISKYLNEIVLTDEITAVSGKTFKGNVQTTNVFTNGLVNGLKIESIADKVFYKSDENVVTEPYVFNGDVEIGNFLATSALDGIPWDKLIFIKQDEELSSSWFLTSIHTGRDVFVNGLLNGCDLTELASKSLHTHKHEQTITEAFNVENLYIEGNLEVKHPVNGVSVDDLKKLINLSEDQIITSDLYIEGNVAAENLNLKGLINGQDINFIYNDAVRHSLPQMISGDKVFKKHLNIGILKGGDLHVRKLDGIDLEKLKETTVRKTGYQEIGGDKIFTSLNIHVTAIKGKLNGLSLPQDVVLVDSTEDITHQTYFMSDVYLSSDLTVNGLTDGVNLTQFILNRVTLSTNQTVNSELVFNHDVIVYDSLLIDGTINEIVLELVAKTKTVHPLQGYKVFVDLLVAGNVSATLVNGFDIAQLNHNVLKYNQEDYINEIQTFEKPISAQNSLITEWINGISVKGITSAFHLMITHYKTAIGFLEDLSAKLQQQLSNQLTAVQEKASKFAYFILLQEINLGPTSKILNGFPERSSNQFTHSMVIWTTQKHCAFMERCCYLEFSYRAKVKKSGFVMVDGAEESGRYYPVYNPDPVESQDIFIWTNNTETQPKWCGRKNEKMLLANYNQQGFLEVFIDIEGAPILSDLKSFKKGKVYIVAAFYYDTKNGEYSSTVVYVYNVVKRQWSEYQTLPSFGVLSMDIIKFTKGYKEDILLALGSGMETYPESYSTVYRWNNKDMLFEKVLDIPSKFVTSTLWVRNGKDMLLIMASVEHWPSKYIDCSGTVTGGQIDIYSYDDKVNLIQSIPLGGVVSVVSFTLGDDVFLAAASSQTQTIYIYEWKGYSKFVEAQSIFVGEVSHLNTYFIDDDIYMTVASLSGSSKILKLIQNGKRSTQAKDFDFSTLELKDEEIAEQKYIHGC